MNQTLTVSSEFFGMTFFFDDEHNLQYAPSFVAGGFDKDCIGYVSEWDDYYQDEETNDVLVPRLLDVIQALLSCWSNEEKRKKIFDRATSKGLSYGFKND